MHSESPRPPPQPDRQHTRTPTPPQARVSYREELARIRVLRADERDEIADERDRVANERETEADRREQNLDALPGNPEGNQADPGSQRRDSYVRAAARTARNQARASREKSAVQRTEAARRRGAVAAPYWPSQLDSGTARTEFLAILQRSQETIAQSQAAVQIARALCEPDREDRRLDGRCQDAESQTAIQSENLAMSNTCPDQGSADTPAQVRN